MTPLYGASPSTWVHWDVMLGLGTDLLPVVCEPGLPISPSSKLASYGKVPSRFDREGRVVGFPKWTQHVSSDDDLATWANDPRLGICLQTRHVRAIDVDIEDFDAAQEVREVLDRWAEEFGVVFHYRVRRNSAKFLCLFTLEGAYGKQVLHTEHGAIELLMTGQQCVVAGCHPSGAEYEWEGGLPCHLPTLTAVQFDALKARLRFRLTTDSIEWTEGRIRKARNFDSQNSFVDDPIIQYLYDRRWVR